MARKQIHWPPQGRRILHTNGATTWFFSINPAVCDTKEPTGTRYEIPDVDGFVGPRRGTYIPREGAASRFKKR